MCNTAVQMNNFAFVLLFSYTVRPVVATHWNLGKQLETSSQQGVNSRLDMIKIPTISSKKSRKFQRNFVQVPASNKKIPSRKCMLFQQEISGKPAISSKEYTLFRLEILQILQLGMEAVKAGNDGFYSKIRATSIWE